MTGLRIRGLPEAEGLYRPDGLWVGGRIKGPASEPCTHSMPRLWWDMMLKTESLVVVVFFVVQMRLSVLQ